MRGLQTTLLAIAALHGGAKGQTPKIPNVINSSLRGSGCESGSVKATSGQLGTFGFTTFTALLGPNASPADTAQVCILQLQFEDIPSGYAMMVKDLVVKGRMHLGSGSQMVLQTLPFGQDQKTRYAERVSP